MLNNIGDITMKYFLILFAMLVVVGCSDYNKNLLGNESALNKPQPVPDSISIVYKIMTSLIPVGGRVEMYHATGNGYEYPSYDLVDVKNHEEGDTALYKILIHKYPIYLTSQDSSMYWIYVQNARTSIDSTRKLIGFFSVN